MSAFRNLAPSTQQAANSSDSSTPQTGISSSQSASTRQTSREANEGNEDLPGDDNVENLGGAEEPLRKRRVPGTVSGRACNECRQARQRCDGVKSHARESQTACSRCAQRNMKCVFEENTKTQKENLIEQLKNAHNLNEELKSDVTNRDSIIRELREINNWRGDILKTIGANINNGEIIQRLRDGQSHQKISEWLHHESEGFRYISPNPDEHQSSSEGVQMLEADYQYTKGYPQQDSLIFSTRPWTSVSADSLMIGRLLDLYFTYVHPVHLLFSEWDFKHCFQVNGTVHCSKPLVNAICAMACYLHEYKPIGHDRFVGLQTTTEAATLRKDFLDEAKKTLHPTNYRLLTSVQAFAVMYLIDLSSGHARTALGYLEAALDGLRFIGESPQSNEAKELTYWGLRNLKIFCVGSTYRMMTFPFPDYPLEFKDINLNVDDEIWRRYYRPGHGDVPRRPTYSVLTAFHQAKLFQIIDENMKLYCGRPQSVTAEAACNQYRRYLQWEQQLTPVLRIITHSREDDMPLPHVLYLHVQYHTAIVQHLSPIVESGFFRDTNLHTLRGFVVSHAWKGVELLQLAQHIYTARYPLPLISFCTVYLGDALLVHSPHLRHGPPNKGPSEVLRICLELLQQTRAGFSLCGPLQKLFLARAIEHDVPIPDGLGEIIGSFGHYDIDSCLDVCTRLSYEQPLERLLPQIHPSIAEDWPAAWRGPLTEKSTTEKAVKISSLLNAD